MSSPRGPKRAPRGGDRASAPTRGRQDPSGRAPTRGAPARGAPARGKPAPAVAARPAAAPPPQVAPGRGKPRGTTSGGPGPRRSTASKGLGGTQVEGRQAVRELLLSERKVQEILIANEMDPAEILTDILELAAERRALVHHVSRGKLDTESRTAASQGVIARADELSPVSLDDLCAGLGGGSSIPDEPPFLIAVDGVTDPGNLGALIRTAECAGVTGLVLPKHRAVHVTPTVTKAAAGAIEHVPMALVGGLPAAIAQMQQRGVWVIGLDAGGETSLHDMTLAAEPVCLVLGAEGAGLSRLVRQRCDQLVSIPLRGQLGSLNVATAGALACYEVVRRRSH